MFYVDLLFVLGRKVWRMELWCKYYTVVSRDRRGGDGGGSEEICGLRRV